MVSMKFSQR
jgi:hypothetical protein